MNMKSILAIGFLSIVAATGVVNATDGIASDANRVDVIGTLHVSVPQQDSDTVGKQRTRVDVIERIGSQGAAYPYNKPMSH
ncbi:MAG: hypothetical protein QM706_21295 [Nitrospira sp.]